MKIGKSIFTRKAYYFALFLWRLCLWVRGLKNVEVVHGFRGGIFCRILRLRGRYGGRHDEVV